MASITNLSGDIINFNTSLEKPLQNLKIHFNPIQEGEGDPSPDNVRPITGWTGINLYHSGKNLWNNEDIIYGYWTDASGKQTANTSGCRTKDIYIIPNTTIKIFYYGVQPYSASIIELNANKEFIKRTHMGWYGSTKPNVLTITTTNETKYIYAQTYVVGNNGIMTYNFLCSCKIQMEFNFQTEYEPFKQLNIVPIDWIDNGTIYGGYVDLVNGKIFNEWAFLHFIPSYIAGVVYDSDTDRYIAASATIGNVAPLAHEIFSDKLAYNYNTITEENRFPGDYYGYTSGDRRLYFSVPSSMSTLADVKSWMSDIGGFDVVYKRETPIEYDIDPITLKTIQGVNNIWSDSNSEIDVSYLDRSGSMLEYRKNIIINSPHIESASDNIASFNTDMVSPLKDCKINFSPIQEGSGDPSPDNVRPISGWNNLDIFSTGKSIAPFLVESIYANNHYNGYSGWSTPWKIPDRTKKYSYSVYIDNTQGTQECRAKIWLRDISNSVYVNGTNRNGNIIDAGISGWSTITIDASNFANSYYFVFGIDLNNGATASYPMVEYSQTSTEYEPYNGSTTSITLPETIYGGYIDPLTGTGKIEWWHHAFTGEETFYDTRTWVTSYLSIDGYNANAQNPAVGICSHYPYGPYGRGKIGVMYNEKACIFDGNIYDADGWKQYCADQYQNSTPVQIAYKLRDPIDFSLDPITLKTLRGINNIWTNSNGTTEVKYWTH